MQVQSLVESLARDRDRKLILERLYADAQAEPPTVQPAAPGSPQQNDPTAAINAAATTGQQLELARANLARLELRLRPEHPDVIKAKRLISDLEQKVQQDAKVAANKPDHSAPSTVPALTPEAANRAERLRQMRAEIESLGREIAFKEKEEVRLRALGAEYQSRVEAAPSLESEWAVLNRDHETMQNMYKDLLAKSDQSKVAAELERRQISEQFRVLNSARVPTRPISPVRWQLNAIGVGVGLLLGCALLALVQLRESSFRNQQDIVDVLNLPVLATVPLVVTAKELVRANRRRQLWSVMTAGLLVVGAGVFWALRLWKHVL
jgi:uncharacterized protein involved in exopolysaccharide biosynthesis